MQRNMYFYVSNLLIFIKGSLRMFSTKITPNTESKCHIIPDCLINMSLKDLQEKLLYACS